MSEMAEAIRELIEQRGYTEESVRLTIENALKAAYKSFHGTSENAIVKFEDDMSDVSLYSRKTVVDGVYDPVTEIELEDAKEYSDDIEVGDQIDILEDPKEYHRRDVSVGKQQAHLGFSETFKESLYNQNKEKVGQVIVGYYQNSKNGNIIVDVGNVGKVEGFLPVKYQSPRETYTKGDRIKAYVTDIKKAQGALQLVLSRIDPKLVTEILSVEVAEIQEGIVTIHKCVREAGFRTKIAVSSVREDVDPVGACVGTKGMRISNVIREFDGERIDVLKYDDDPIVFIKNALSPAQVEKVVILDADKKQALAIVEESQLSLAIGKQGMNVRLANRLCDWNIDVKTVEQAKELDLSDVTANQAAMSLFNDVEEESDITSIKDLPGVDENVAEILESNGISDLSDFMSSYENISVEGVSKEDLEKIYELIKENVEFVEEESDLQEESSQQEQEEKYYCPECGAEITLDMTHCPKCGVEFEFEEDEE